jgi:glycosyltransferase involved in cell wall biosynthesis
VLSKVTYNPQGMFIEQALLNGLYNIKKYKSLNIFYFESKRAVNVFCEMGINAKYYSNGKYFDLEESYLKLKEAPFTTLNLVFISRICEEKGVLLIFDALEKLQNRLNGVVVSVDFYGPIAADFKETFESQLIGNTHYCGYLDMLNDLESSYRKLSNYDAMILPTHWKGEGIAGVFIDAFISGLPILTTSWGVNEEIITNDVNGWIVPPNDSDSLVEKLMEITGDFDKLNQMKIAAFEKRRNFHITKIQETLINDVSAN